MTLKRSLLLLLSAMLLTLTASGAMAQAEADEPVEELTSRVKKISISFNGGYYSGTTFLDLPVVDQRAQLADGSNHVTLFNGESLNLGDSRPENGFDAPMKEIETGEVFGVNIGFYMSDSFHLDLNASYSRSRAILSMARFQDDVLVERVYGEDLDAWYEGFYDETSYAGGSVDESFKSYMGGISVSYDAGNLKTFGMTPFFGMGFGGIINRFTVLEDKTALYFHLFWGLDVPLTRSIHVNTRISATTFAFQTEEVTYAEQVNTMTASIGLTLHFDVKPIH